MFPCLRGGGGCGRFMNMSIRRGSRLHNRIFLFLDVRFKALVAVGGDFIAYIHIIYMIQMHILAGFIMVTYQLKIYF